MQPANVSPGIPRVEELVSDWNDDVVAIARFKAFGGEDDHERQLRLLFWTDLILKSARQLGALVVNAEEIKCTWFRRGGLTPMALDFVLENMIHTGQLKDKEEYKSGGQGFLKWLLLRFGVVKAPAGKMHPEAQEGQVTPLVTGEYVVLPLIKEKAEELLEEGYSAGTGHVDRIVTLASLEEMAGGQEEALLLSRFLILQRLAVSLVAKDAALEIQGLKVAKRGSRATGSTALDLQVLQLKGTLEMLHKRYSKIAARSLELQKMAHRLVKDGQQQAARHALKLKRLLTESQEKCALFIQQLEAVLLSVSEVELTSQVFEALQAGSAAVKESGMTLNQVQKSMSEWEDAYLKHSKTMEALGGATQEVTSEDEDEYARIEKELNTEALAPSGPEAVPVVQHRSQQSSAQDEIASDTVVNQLSRMSLQPSSGPVNDTTEATATKRAERELCS
eukprot:SM000225S07029  [mRNA]  locus=s225:111586:114547:- [translate_table: standard]